MKRQPNKKDKQDPEVIIKQARLDILSMLQKQSLKIIPADFSLEIQDDITYPKYVKLPGGGGKVVYSKEEERALLGIEQKKKPGRPPRSVKNGDSQDSATGNQFSV